MKRLTKELKKLWNDESAQGATEYILLLVVVVGLVLAFRGEITKIVKEKVNALGGEIKGITSQ
jgi:Flp pilus assembly pilin Flp